MARRFSLPFKTVVGDEVRPQAWHYRDSGGDWLRMGPSMPGWDYLRAIDLRRAIVIDVSGVKQACGLDEGAELSLVVTASCPAARFRRIMCNQQILAHGVNEVTFALPSLELAGRLHLETEILLRTPANSADRFAARYLGSRLYAESCSLDLEGTGSRMPMEIASFIRELPGLNAPRAPWHVECGSGDLHLPVMQELRVYLNAEAKSTLEAILAGDVNLQLLLKAEVAIRILQTALADNLFRGNETDFAEGTLGEAAVRLMRLCFPGQTARDISVLAGRQPARFDANIRSWLAASHD